MDFYRTKFQKLLTNAIKYITASDNHLIKLIAGDAELMPINLRHLGELTLLWQSGYLTIEEYNRTTGQYKVGVNSQKNKTRSEA